MAQAERTFQEFSNRPEVIQHFDLLSRIGVIEFVENQEARINDLEDLISEGVEIFNTQSVEGLINHVTGRLLHKVVPSYLAFVFQNQTDPSTTRVACFHNLKPIDPPFRIDTLRPLREFFSKYPGPIHFELLEYNLGRPDVTNALRALAPEIVVPITGLGGLYGFVVFGKKVLDQEYSQREIDYIVKLMRFSSISLQNNINYNTAITDQKTQLYNHPYFIKRLREELSRVTRYDAQLALLILDVDRFKNFNDSHGHLAGDSVLAHVAETIRGHIREGDVAARFGGEEFVVLLLQCDRDASWAVAERIRKAIGETPVPYQGEDFSVTVSVGAYHLTRQRYVEGDTLIRYADTALYEAKRAGRNRTVFYKPGLYSTANSYRRWLEKD
jgi:diguanylate cyclase (GGDEF)-like protein